MISTMLKKTSQLSTRHFVQLRYRNTQTLNAEMPFENLKTFQRNAEFENPVDQLVNTKYRWLVGGWLLLTAAGVYYMVLLGGYTRLSHSGLSMTKWRPIEYSFPGTEEQWQKEYDHYKEFPEYMHSPQQISLDRFKRIYFVEYLHRVSGSALGALFVLPLATFSALKWVKPKFSLRLSCIGALGATQGLIGWWMVKSGLNQPKPTYQTKPRVSTYRLIVHLGMAMSIYSLLLWNAMTVLRKPQHLSLTPGNYGASNSMRRLSIVLLHFVAINILSGATMAGIDAGKVYNTWPSMNGQVIPEGLFKFDPFWKNFFENHTLQSNNFNNIQRVQFNHRLMAYLTYALTLYMGYRAYNAVLPRQIKLASLLVFALVNYQVYNGVSALLDQVPLHKGSIHQWNGLNVLTATLFLLHSSRRPSLAYRGYLKQFM